MQVPPNQQDPLEQQDRSTTGSIDQKTMEIAASTGEAARAPYGGHKGDSSMFCTACGTKNATDANYCKQCGRRIEHTASIRISDEAFAEAGSPDEQVRAHLMRAYNRYEAGDLVGAIESCQKALGVQPDSTDAHSLLSTLYEKQGDRDKAIAEREIVLQLNPGSIADREKLEQLRDTSLVITPRKITNSRPTGTILDSRAGAAIVAVAVTLFVMVAGLAAVLVARSRPVAVQAQSQKPGPVTLPNQANPQVTVTNPAQPNAGPRSTIQFPPAQQTVQNNAAAQLNRRQVPVFTRNEDSEPPRPIPPASIQVPAEQNRFAPQDTAPNRSAGNTVHLPDNGLSPSEVGPGPGAQGSAQQVTQQQPPQQPAQPAPNRGKIEIIVSPGTPGGAGQTAATSGRGSDAASSSMDSRSAKRIAQDYQLKGQYKLAISNYIKALDGAGEDAGSIHYQIGLCYQRLDERENAIAQYNASIAAYREQIGAGRNTDSANRGIRAAETAIKACQ